jgi:hypothetical protein
MSNDLSGDFELYRPSYVRGGMSCVARPCRTTHGAPSAQMNFSMTPAKIRCGVFTLLKNRSQVIDLITHYKLATQAQKAVGTFKITRIYLLRRMREKTIFMSQMIEL